MKYSYGIVFATFCGALLAKSVQADEKPLNAQGLAKRALKNNLFAAENARAEVELELKRRGKVVRKRKLRTKFRRKKGEVRSMVEFTSPAEVSGTRFLSIEEEGKAKQFIYLPAFRTVKRIVGAQREKSFMGTDFSYSDLEGRKVDSSSWKQLADAKVGGQDCYVLEAVPKKAEGETYGRSIMWVHKKYHLPMKIDFYGQDKATVAKQFRVKKLAKKGKRWIATVSSMATVKKGTETQLLLKAIDFDAEIPDSELNKQALKK